VSNSDHKTRRDFSAEFKSRVVLELIRGEKSLAQMSAEHGIKDTVLSRWKQEFLARCPLVFAGSPSEQDLKLAQLERALDAQAQELAILKKAFLLLDGEKGSKS
jgi:transposase-like protein